MSVRSQMCPTLARRCSGRAMPVAQGTVRSMRGRHAKIFPRNSSLAGTPTPRSSTVRRVASTETLTADETQITAQDTSQAAPEPSSDSAPFNWFQQWYPVASLDALDPTRPHPFTLLGQNLVLWRDGSGSWRAFKDACPHRLAPLSEGRVEKDGTLLCAYHGWRFNGAGACTALPYCRADDPAYRSPRSCAVPYPTQQRGGLLWVWGEGGPGAAAIANTKLPTLPPEVQEDGSLIPGATGNGWVSRDMPYGLPVLVENTLDPAHVPVSHHKIAGNRYSDPKPFSMEFVRPVTRDGGFLVRIPDPMRTNAIQGFQEFVPPGRVRVEYELKNGSRSILILLGAPSRPGSMRFTGTQIMVEAPGSAARAKSLVGIVGDKLPSFLSHVLGGLFLNQDAVFLHYQEHEVMRQQQLQLQEKQTAAGAAADGDNGAQAEGRLPVPRYYMPGQTDKGVAAWRNWLYKYGGGDVSYAPGTPPLEVDVPSSGSRSQIFDTWTAHTRNCTICLAALARLRLVRAVAAAVGAAAAVTAFAAVLAKAVVVNVAAAATAAAAATSSTSAAATSGGLVAVLQAAGSVLLSWQGLAAVVVVALAAVAVLITNKLEQMMHKYEYSHADNH